VVGVDGREIGILGLEEFVERCPDGLAVFQPEAGKPGTGRAREPQFAIGRPDDGRQLGQHQSQQVFSIRNRDT